MIIELIRYIKTTKDNQINKIQILKMTNLMGKIKIRIINNLINELVEIIKYSILIIELIRIVKKALNVIIINK